MTRSGGRRGTGDAIAELFATSAPEAVLRVLRESGRALAKSEIIDQLAAVGVPRARADKAWSQAQKRLRQDSRVIAEKDRQIVRYRWNPQPPPAPTPNDALTLLVEGRLTRGEREALAEVDPEAEEARAHELVVKRLRTMTITTREQQLSAARRLVGMLARKGYDPGTVYGVVRRALAERGAELAEVDTGLESEPDVPDHSDG